MNASTSFRSPASSGPSPRRDVGEDDEPGDERADEHEREEESGRLNADRLLSYVDDDEVVGERDGELIADRIERAATDRPTHLGVGRWEAVEGRNHMDRARTPRTRHQGDIKAVGMIAIGDLVIELEPSTNVDEVLAVVAIEFRDVNDRRLALRQRYEKVPTAEVKREEGRDRQHDELAVLKRVHLLAQLGSSSPRSSSGAIRYSVWQ